MSNNTVKEYVALDIETSGLSAENDEILRIVAVKRDSEFEKSIDELDVWIKPTKPLSAEVKTLIGIDESVIDNATDISAAITAFNGFASDLPLVSHNADFTIRFLKNIYIKILDKDLNNKVFCTLKMATTLAKNDQAFKLKSYRLVDVLRKYLNPNYQRSNSELDEMFEETHMTGLLFEKIIKLLDGGNNYGK